MRNLQVRAGGLKKPNPPQGKSLWSFPEAELSGADGPSWEPAGPRSQGPPKHFFGGNIFVLNTFSKGPFAQAKVLFA